MRIEICRIPDIICWMNVDLGADGPVLTCGNNGNYLYYGEARTVNWQYWWEEVGNWVQKAKTDTLPSRFTLYYVKIDEYVIEKGNRSCDYLLELLNDICPESAMIAPTQLQYGELMIDGYHIRLDYYQGKLSVNGTTCDLPQRFQIETFDTIGISETGGSIEVLLTENCGQQLYFMGGKDRMEPLFLDYLNQLLQWIKEKMGIELPI